MFKLNPKYSRNEPVTANYTALSALGSSGVIRKSSAKTERNDFAKPEKEGHLLEQLFVVSVVLTIQLALACGGYSGYNNPPMHGDYEAQRHWMEITYHTPINEWYISTSANNLLYWGLDYPPLTAYHSWAMGAIAHHINSSWVALGSSRGIETNEHKMFMRLSAIVPFVTIYAPSVLSFAYGENMVGGSPMITSFFLLFYPGLLAMDNAHFQYNSISLGLFIWSYLFLSRDRTLIGSICFVLAVNYKQMELYHSLPIFIFILARCIKRPLFSRIHISIWELTKVGTVVLSTFLLLWIPFLLNGKEQLLAVVGRIFPFYRGLFEDKVASVWCAFSFLIKFNRLFTVETQLRLSTLLVLLCSLPSLCVLFIRPSSRNLRLSLLSVSLAFFLFSFQVHEKSILLPATAALLLLPEHPIVVTWFLNISCTSMFSLCLKDGNGLLIVLFGAYYVAVSSFYYKAVNNVQFSILHSSTLGAFLICIFELLLTPPTRLPHLFPLLNAFYSCCHFLALLVYINYLIITEENNKRKCKNN